MARKNDTAETPKKPRRTRLSAEARTEHLLDSAADVIIEHGIEALTMESVAARAQVSRALSYFYFESRSELIRALYNRELDRLYEAVLPALEGGGSLEKRVRAGVRAHFDIVDSQHDLFETLSAALGGSDDRETQHQRHRSWEDYVGTLTGDEFHKTPTQARVLARILINLNARCAALWKREGLDRDEVEEICVQFQLGGLLRALEASSPADSASAKT